MPTTNIKLGYGGGASIGGAPVFVTGGSLSRALTTPRITPYSSPTTATNRAAVAACKGVYSYNGSISFDLSVSAINSLINHTFLKRNNTFTVWINDGNKGYSMQHCKFDSFSVSAAPNALITGSINFQSASAFTASTATPVNVFNSTAHTLAKYWQSGNTGVESFTLTINQPITPVYLNYVDGTDAQRAEPQYLRAGLWDITLEVSAFTGWLSHTEIFIGPKKFQITKGLEETRDFSYGGQSDTGAHSYLYRAHALGNSGASFFNIV